MRNISAVMEQQGEPILKGYLPAENVGEAVAKRLWLMTQQELAAASTLPPSKTRLGDRKPLALTLTRHPTQPPIIYFNIGWMKHYAGTDPDDPTRGNMGFLKENKHGAEAFNFLPTQDGKLRGYRAGHANQLNISRLGSPAGADRMEGVLVIWMARDPGTKRALVVGWYEDATVYAQARPQPRLLDGETWPYSVETSASKGHLLPPGTRTFLIQSSRTSEGGFGMSPTWYGTDAVNARVWAYVRSVKAGIARRTAKPPIKKPPINTDPELRRKVEKAAINHATAFYESAEGGAYDVASVEPFGVGWDLEATNDEGRLLIEVKGLQGPDLVCELTPNEYEKMLMPENRDKYVIYVVNSALSETPIASVFQRNQAGTWETSDGRCLKMTPKTGAVLRCD